LALLSKMLADWRHSLISDYIRGDVLDIGCGNSIILQKFGDQINSYCGVELSTKRFADLKKKFPQANFIARDLDNDALEIDQQFDLIVMIAIVEHIWNQKFLIEQLVRLLTSDGKIIITTPTPFGNDIVHTAGAKIGLFAKSAVDDHVVIYNRRRFENLANEFDLTILEYKRFQFFCNQFVVLGKNAAEK